MSENHPAAIKIRALWPLLFPLLIFLPGLAGFPYPSSEATFSDLAITHYPNAVYLKRAITEFGSLPLWSPTILSGYPFMANPLSGLWYPPGWFALIFPLPLGFNLVVALHILWGGLGMYVLLRAEGLRHPAGLLGGLAFAVMPKLYAHYGAGHLSLLYAIPWTPWLFLTCRDDPLSSCVKPVLRFRWKASLILALIFLADPRWAVFAGLGWIFYCLSYSHGVREGAQGRETPGERIKLLRIVSRSIYRLKYPVFQGFGALLLASPLLLPLLEYTRLSTRSQLSAVDVLDFSLPPARLLGLVFPDWGGPHEWVLYPGGLVLVLGLVAVLVKISRPFKGFWLWLGLLALIFALGSNLPVLPWLARLPGFNLLRVPSRALFLTGMATAALAAYGLDVLEKTSSFQNWRGVNLGLAALMASTVSLTIGFLILVGEAPENIIWGTAVIVIAVWGVWTRMRLRTPSPIWNGAILSLLLLDIWVMDTSVLVFRSAETVLAEQKGVVEYLSAQEGDFRVYSPSYSLPQHVAASAGLELADGVDPLQLQAYVDFMAAATRVPGTGYSVTLPPFAAGKPASDNAGYLPDPFLLGLLNVRFVIAEFDLMVDGLEFRKQIGLTRIYENGLVLPRAWVQSAYMDVGRVIRAVESLEWSPNQIIVSASGPGLLVLSEISYPGWRVTMDGEPAALETIAGLFRAVRLDPGVHRIVFSFYPVSLYLGFAGFSLGLILLVVPHKKNRS